MEVIGIGGAGGKIATKIDKNSLVINVSEVELNKIEGANKILACVHNENQSQGQLKGSKKNPSIGRKSFESIHKKLLNDAQGKLLISSTGGGTGNGICSELLDVISTQESIDEDNKTSFAFILPYANKEASEYIINTVDFLSGSLSVAIDSANTGNIYLFSNKNKFQGRISEENYNNTIVESLKIFDSIPTKGNQYDLLEGHIDEEDFNAFRAKSFFNHFCSFSYNPSEKFGVQLEKNYNKLLLAPDTAIEALFLLEVPNKEDASICYGILDHFSVFKVAPIFSVVHNPNITQPFITVSLLYSRKPTELVNDFHRISEESTKTKIDRSINQQTEFENVAVNLQKTSYQEDKDITSILKRLGKI